MRRAGRRGRAAQLYELLHPFADRNVTPPQAVFAGPVERFLGILAATGGDSDRAESHFEAAHAAAARMNAPPVHVRVFLDHATLLARRDERGDRDRALEMIAEAGPAAELGMEPIACDSRRWRSSSAARAEAECGRAHTGGRRLAATLRCEGDFWTFELGGRSVRMRDSKGVRYIAALLSAPGIECMPRSWPGGAAEPERTDGHAAEMDGVAGDDAGPLLDAQAKQAYRDRLDELRAELDEAESFNDPERAARAQEEIDSCSTSWRPRWASAAATARRPPVRSAPG